MRWQEIGENLQAELKLFHPEAATQLSGRELLALDHRTRKGVNAAVKVFCASGKWGNLDDIEVSALCHRLRFALELITRLQRPAGVAPTLQPRYTM